MKKAFKRVLSVLLTLVLLCGVAPFTGFKGLTASAAGYTTGDLFTFGSYPQTKVTDTALITALDSQPLQADNTVTYNGSKYLKQTDWFKFEPIQWRVLSNTNGELFVMADKILSSRAYEFGSNITWETCILRSWLNNGFYNTAFNSSERAKIESSTISNENNPWYGTAGGNNTSDKLFLLSYAEAMNPAYGFSSSYSTYDTARVAQGTDYAKSQGLYVYGENSGWWLRSPGDIPSKAGYVDVTGNVDRRGDGYYVYRPYIGARPAFKINLSSIISKIDFYSAGGSTVPSLEGNVGEAVTVPPEPNRAGYIFTGWEPALPAIFPDGNLTVTAQWQVKQYRMTFDANGGTGGTSELMEYGAALTTPEVSRFGYTFAGWSPEVPATVPAADTIYIAQWSLNFMIGDVNADGRITSIDALKTLQAAAGIITLTTAESISADVDFSNSITVVDALKILQFAARIIISF